MIGFLKGKATHITSDYCLLDVHDVGYRVFISNQTRAHISPNAEVMLTFIQMYERTPFFSMDSFRGKNMTCSSF